MLCWVRTEELSMTILLVATLTRNSNNDAERIYLGFVAVHNAGCVTLKKFFENKLLKY